LQCESNRIIYCGHQADAIYENEDVEDFEVNGFDMGGTFQTKPEERYDGPDFLEFCISEGQFLPASRDRSPCLTCPLSRLCQPGFEEQVRRVANGQEASLTASCVFTEEELKPENVLRSLSNSQVAFLRSKVPSLRTED